MRTKLIYSSRIFTTTKNQGFRTFVANATAVPLATVPLGARKAILHKSIIFMLNQANSVQEFEFHTDFENSLEQMGFQFRWK